MFDTNHDLTKRERQILVCIVNGKQNKEIASLLSISESTVENHLHNIFNKLGVKNRTQAALHAITTKLIIPDRKNEGNPS